MLKTGKWYVEHKIDSTGYNLCFSQIDHPSGATPSSSNSKSIGWYIPNGYVYWGAGYSGDLGGTTMTGLDSSGYMSNAAVGDVIAAAIDMDNSTIKFYKNGSEVGSIDFSTGNAHRFTEGMYVSQFSGYGHWNFGARPFAYTPPTNYVSLCTQNLSDPTIADGSTAMDVSLWTGNGAARSISGLNFSPDFVWMKARTLGSANHGLFDIVRGATKRLISNGNAAESTQSQTLTAFNSDGFDLGTDTAYNGNTYPVVGWAWDAGSSTASNTDGSITSQVRASQTAGFSIVSYAGALSSAGSSTVGHGLNAAPSLIIVKNRDDGAEDWVVFHESLGNAAFVRLNQTNAQNTGSSMWGSTSPTSSVFTVGYSAQANISGDDHIAYCFAPVEGYSAFGSYEGNGDGNGPFVYTGFRPAFLMIKASSTTGNWHMHDTSRSVDNPAPERLFSNLTNAEQTSSAGNIDILSNGFKLKNSTAGYNADGVTHVYVAFAEHPFKTARAR